MRASAESRPDPENHRASKYRIAANAINIDRHQFINKTWCSYSNTYNPVFVENFEQQAVLVWVYLNKVNSLTDQRTMIKIVHMFMATSKHHVLTL